MKYWLFVFFMMLFFVQESIAQENDFGIWASVDITKDISKKLKATVTEEFRFKENCTQLGAYFTNVSLEYKINKSFSASANYRFIEKEALNLFYVPRHRFFVDGSYKYKHNKFSATLRTRIQYQISRISNDYVILKPQWYWRNKLSLKYEVKKFKPYFSYEVFYQLNNPAGNVVDEMRYSLGSNYDINKKSSIDIYYMIDREMQVYNPLTSFIVGVGYSFSF